MMIKLGMLSVLSLLLGLAATNGCSSIEHAYDCNAICDKYKTCADASYDDGACTDRCRDMAADSDAFADKADDCQACIDDRSCIGSVFNCASECAGIVP